MENPFHFVPFPLYISAASSNKFSVTLQYVDTESFVISKPNAIPFPWDDSVSRQNDNVNFLFWFDYGTEAFQIGREQDLENAIVTVVGNDAASWKVEKTYDKGPDKAPVCWQIYPTEGFTFGPKSQLSITFENIQVNTAEGLTTLYMKHSLSPIKDKADLSIPITKKAKPIFTQIVGYSCTDSPEHTLSFAVDPDNDGYLQFILDGLVARSKQKNKLSDSFCPHWLSINDQQTGCQTEQVFPIHWLRLDKGGLNSLWLSWEAEDISGSNLQYFLLGQKVPHTHSTKVDITEFSDTFSASLTVTDEQGQMQSFRWDLQEFSLPKLLELTACITNNNSQNGFMPIEQLEQPGQLCSNGIYSSFDPPPPPPPPPMKTVTVAWKTKNAHSVTLEGKPVAESGTQKIQVLKSQTQITMTVALNNGFSRAYSCEISEESE